MVISFNTVKDASEAKHQYLLYYAKNQEEYTHIAFNLEHLPDVCKWLRLADPANYLLIQPINERWVSVVGGVAELLNKGT